MPEETPTFWSAVTCHRFRSVATCRDRFELKSTHIIGRQAAG